MGRRTPSGLPQLMRLGQAGQAGPTAGLFPWRLPPEPLPEPPPLQQVMPQQLSRGPIPLRRVLLVISSQRIQVEEPVLLP